MITFPIRPPHMHSPEWLPHAPLSPFFPSSWLGTLHLRYHYPQDSTKLKTSRAQAPLKIQRSFYPEGPRVCHGVILHTAGGVVGGDRLSMDIHLDSQAHTLLTTAAASKIYGSRGRSQTHPQGQQAHQTVHITLAPDTCLEWLPQETIVFNGAIYRQDLRVELAESALWLGWDITRFGRSARGEQFLQGDWRSHTEIWQAGKPLWIDPQRFTPSPERITSLHGLAGQSVVGSLAFVGCEVSKEVVTQIRHSWTELLETELLETELLETELLPKGGDRPEVGITRLQSGLLCRYRGSSTTEARRWLTTVWNLLRKTYLGRSPCRPRVWPS